MYFLPLVVLPTHSRFRTCSTYGLLSVLSDGARRSLCISPEAMLPATLCHSCPFPSVSSFLSQLVVLTRNIFEDGCPLGDFLVLPLLTGAESLPSGRCGGPGGVAVSTTNRILPSEGFCPGGEKAE